jgi:WD40 repeat protein
LYGLSVLAFRNGKASNIIVKFSNCPFGVQKELAPPGAESLPMHGNPDLPCQEPHVPALKSVPALIRVFGDFRFHTDGDLLALAFRSREILWSLEEPGVLRQWNVTTGQPQGSQLLSDLETLWTFSEDGRVLVSGSDEVGLWETASGRLLTTVPQPSWVTAVAIRKQPAMLATGHDDGVARLWQIPRPRIVHELAGHEGPIGVLAFSPDGARVATAGEDGIIRIWETATGGLLGTLTRHTDRIGGLAWHPAGRLLVSAAWDRTARVWDTTTFEPLILLNSHADQVTALAFSPDGQTLACADSAHTIRIWDPVAGIERHVLQEHQDEIRSLAFSPDSSRLASGGADRMIHVWDAHEGRLLSGRGRPARSRTGLVVSTSGERLASTCGGVHLRVWDTLSGQPSRTQLEGHAQPQVLKGSPDGRWIAGGGPDHRIHLWEAATGRLHATLDGQAGRVAALAFAADSTILASASEVDGTVWLWNILLKEPILVIPMAADACTVEALAFHPHGPWLAAGGIDWLATGGSDGAISVWDIQQRTQNVIFNRGTTDIAFHPQGQYLAATTLDRSVVLYDLSTQQMAIELTGHGDAVSCLAYSPDGAWLISGSEDRTIRFWNGTTGELAVVQSLDTPVKALGFSSDGRYLYTGNANTTSYQLDVQALLEEVAQPAQ